MELLPQDEITEEHYCSTGLSTDGLVIMAFRLGDSNKTYMTCYLYDYDSKEVVKTIDAIDIYNSNYNKRPSALRVHGGLYGTYYENDVVKILEYSTGRRIATDVRYATVEQTVLIDNKYFLILKRNKHVDVVYAKTGRVVGSIGPIDAISGGYPTVIYSEDEIYFEITAADGVTKKVYKIEIDM